jgi:hypothetical protein
MPDDPENIVLKQLSLLRGEVQEGFAKITAEQVRTDENVGALASTLVGVQRDIRSYSTRLLPSGSPWTITHAGSTASTNTSSKSTPGLSGSKSASASSTPDPLT